MILYGHVLVVINTTKKEINQANTKTFYFENKNAYIKIIKKNKNVYINYLKNKNATINYFKNKNANINYLKNQNANIPPTRSIHNVTR